MGRSFLIITLLLLLHFTACIKRECRKKEDTVSGDALEIVIAKYNKFIYPAIPDSFYFKKHPDSQGYYVHAVILNEDELNILNHILIRDNYDYTIPNIDFTKYSYYLFNYTKFGYNKKINVNLQLNNSDSISCITEVTEFRKKSIITNKISAKEEDILFIIKVKKINKRNYEKITYSYCI